MNLKRQVEATIHAIVNATGTLNGTVNCPKCGGKIPWRYNGDDLNFFCNSQGCVFSSDAVKDAVMLAAEDTNMPLVFTRPRSTIIMTKEHAEFKADEMRREMLKESDDLACEGAYEESEPTDEWCPKTEREKLELDRVTLEGITAGTTKFGPVIEKQKADEIFEVRRAWYKGKKTRIWVNREVYEKNARWVEIHGAWPDIVYPDHLEDTVSVGTVEKPM
jgi:hypothetical protein